MKNSIFEIVGVELMKWKGGEFDITPRSYSALSFRISGNAEITVNGKKIFAEEGSVLYMPQETGYHASYTDTEIAVIHFVTSKTDTAPEIYNADKTEEIYRLFLQAHTLWKNKKTSFTLYTMSSLYNILGRLLDCEAPKELPAQLMKSVAFINAGYRKSELSVADVCKNAGISESGLRKLFNKYFFKSPMEYIIELRLENAKNLIANGKTVEYAAYESGFCDPKYFARLTKKKLGCSPHEFKNFGK